MKKILHISKYYYPYFGGIEDVAQTIVEELIPYYEQRVICFNHEKGFKHDTVGVEITRVGTVYTFSSQPISQGYKNKLQNLINEFEPDFIHIHLPNPLIALLLLTVDLGRAKLITHWHADILDKKLFYLFCKPIEERILSRSYKVLTTSDMYKQSSLPLQSVQDITYILPNTINEPKFEPTSDEVLNVNRIKQKYNNKKIVFFVGRHVNYKGIDYLIEAEQYIEEDCVVLIAGSGDETLRLKNLAINKERIHFIGKISNEDLKHYLYASTVFAFPSHTRSEAFGVALAEALYCGLPAVSFHIEGSGALWVNKHNHTGLVVENRNAAAFGAAISTILASDELRTEYSKNAVAWVKTHFLKDQILPIMREIYK